MTPKPTHTPTPYKIEGSAITAHGGYSESWNKQIPPTEHRTIVASINQNLENWDTNAAFIIRAVNAYEPTKDAIEKFLLAIGMVTGIERARREFIEAIAKAEGK